MPDDLKDEVATECDLCHDIRSHLVLRRKIDSRELQPKGFYEND